MDEYGMLKQHQEEDITDEDKLLAEEKEEEQSTCFYEDCNRQEYETTNSLF